VIGDFKGVGYFEAEFLVKVTILCTIRYGNGCTTTLLLEGSYKETFVAEFIRLKLTFIPKNEKIVF